MSDTDPRPDVSTVDLVKEAIDESKALLMSEIALARNEAKRDLAAFKRGAISLASAAVAANLGVALLLVAMVLSTGAPALAALIAGGVLLLGAGIAGGIGYKLMPKKPMQQTQERLRVDAQVLKERIA